MAVYFALGAVYDRDTFLYAFRTSPQAMEREKSEIIGTIREYDKILTDIYVTGGVPALLNEFPATKAVRHGLFRDIGFIRDSKRVLVYDLADVIPVDVRIRSFESAEAVVLEEWNYLYQQSADRIPLTPVKGMAQGFRYRLSREKGRWIIKAWDPVDVVDPGQREFKY